MKNIRRCALATLFGAIALTSAIIAVSISAGKMIADGASSMPPRSVMDMRSRKSDGLMGST